jgi:hypothetical protein
MAIVIGQKVDRLGLVVSYPGPSHFRSTGCIASPRVGDVIHPALRKFKWEGPGYETIGLVLFYGLVGKRISSPVVVSIFP